MTENASNNQDAYCRTIDIRNQAISKNTVAILHAKINREDKEKDKDKDKDKQKDKDKEKQKQKQTQKDKLNKY